MFGITLAGQRLAGRLLNLAILFADHPDTQRLEEHVAAIRKEDARS